MKRTLIFLVLGPVAVAITVFATLVAVGAPSNFAQFLAAALAFLTFPVAAFAGLADGVLAPTLPIPLRAPLTAIVGATLACVPAFALLHCFLPSSELMFLPLGGAVCAGLCSLLSHDYGSWQQPVAREHGLPQHG
jgi:hypothetical protein